MFPPSRPYMCRPCSTARAREWRVLNPERAKAARRATYEQHREDSIRRALEWNRAHPERCRKTMRRWAAVHRDELKQANIAWRKANPAWIVQHNRAYYVAHRVEAIRLTTEWQRANPEKVRTYRAATRARRAGAGGSHTEREWLDKCALLGNVCIYCGEAKPLTEDHKIPLSRGGSNDITNIVPACLSCNSRKSTKTAPEFIAWWQSAMAA